MMKPVTVEYVVIIKRPGFGDIRTLLNRGWALDMNSDQSGI